MVVSLIVVRESSIDLAAPFTTPFISEKPYRNEEDGEFRKQLLHRFLLILIVQFGAVLFRYLDPAGFFDVINWKRTQINGQNC